MQATRLHRISSAPLAMLGALALAALLAGCAAGSGPAADATSRMARVKNVVVIYAENHSFDNMYGMFPGANGVANATPEQATQLGHDGKPLPEVAQASGDPRAERPA